MTMLSAPKTARPATEQARPMKPAGRFSRWTACSMNSTTNRAVRGEVNAGEVKGDELADESAQHGEYDPIEPRQAAHGEAKQGWDPCPPAAPRWS